MVKNITLSADETLIHLARARAAHEKRSLNSVFRQWLERYTTQNRAVDGYEELMKRLDHVDAGGPYTRQERNER